MSNGFAGSSVFFPSVSAADDSTQEIRRCSKYQAGARSSIALSQTGRTQPNVRDSSAACSSVLSDSL